MAESRGQGTRSPNQDPDLALEAAGSEIHRLEKGICTAGWHVGRQGARLLPNPSPDLALEAHSLEIHCLQKGIVLQGGISGEPPESTLSAGTWAKELGRTPNTGIRCDSWILG